MEQEKITAYIYKIISLDDDKTYIGSTTKKPKERLKGHEKDYKRYQKGKFSYVTSFDILATGNYRVEKIKKVKVSCKKELHDHERYYIESTECVNKVIPSRTRKQYRQDNKEKIAEQKKQYRQDNKEKIAERQKQYRQDNKDKINQKHICQCGSSYTQSHKARHMRTKKHIAYLESLKE